MRYVAEQQQQSQTESAGAFRASGLPDWIDQEMSDDEFSRRCDEFEQEMAEQQAESAIVDRYTQYGVAAAAGVIRRALDRASQAIVMKGRLA